MNYINEWFVLMDKSNGIKRSDTTLIYRETTSLLKFIYKLLKVLHINYINCILNVIKYLKIRVSERGSRLKNYKNVTLEELTNRFPFVRIAPEYMYSLYNNIIVNDYIYLIHITFFTIYIKLYLIILCI